MVEDPVLKQRHEFHHPSADLLVVESWVDPGGGVTPHVHPSQHERFEVLDGECTFTVGRDKVVKRAGEAAEVPPGTRHAYANKGTVQLHMRCEVTPPMTLEEFLTDVAAMSRAGLITSFGLPKGWKGLLGARPAVISLPSWSRSVNGPRTTSGPSRYGVISAMCVRATRFDIRGNRVEPAQPRPGAHVGSGDAPGCKAPADHRCPDREV